MKETETIKKPTKQGYKSKTWISNCNLKCPYSSWRQILCPKWTPKASCQKREIGVEFLTPNWVAITSAWSLQWAVRVSDKWLRTGNCLRRNQEVVIGGNLIPHKRVHKDTWLSPDNATENQIDRIAISSKWLGSFQDVRGADIVSDPQLLTAKVHLKIVSKLLQMQRGWSTEEV